MAAPSAEDRAIVERMLAHARGARASLGAAPGAATGCPGFLLESFGVTYPNEELLANVEVTGVPAGATLLGATILVTPGSSSDVTYCMGVAANSAGLPLPLSLLAGTSAASFGTATQVTGMVVLCYTRDGSSQEQCTVSRAFTVGG